MAEQQLDTAEFPQRIQMALAELFTKIGQAIQPVIESTLAIAAKVSDAIHTAYIEDGAIYGDTHEGLMRWMSERGEINRLRTEAERIEQHQAAVRDFKYMIIKKAVNQPVDVGESE